MTEPPDEADPWVTLSEAASRTGRHIDAVRSLVRRRKLPARKGNNGAWLVQPWPMPASILASAVSRAARASALASAKAARSQPPPPTCSVTAVSAAALAPRSGCVNGAGSMVAAGTRMQHDARRCLGCGASLVDRARLAVHGTSSRRVHGGCALRAVDELVLDSAPSSRWPSSSSARLGYASASGMRCDLERCLLLPGLHRQRSGGGLLPIGCSWPSSCAAAGIVSGYRWSNDPLNPRGRCAPSGPAGRSSWWVDPTGLREREDSAI